MRTFWNCGDCGWVVPAVCSRHRRLQEKRESTQQRVVAKYVASGVEAKMMATQIFLMRKLCASMLWYPLSYQYTQRIGARVRPPFDRGAGSLGCDCLLGSTTRWRRPRSLRVRWRRRWSRRRRGPFTSRTGVIACEATRRLGNLFHHQGAWHVMLTPDKLKAATCRGDPQIVEVVQHSCRRPLSKSV